MWIIVLFLIKEQVQTLLAIERKAGVTRYKCHSLCNSMRNDNVVGGILMPVLNIGSEAGVCLHVLTLEWQDTYKVEIFN